MSPYCHLVKSKCRRDLFLCATVKEISSFRVPDAVTILQSAFVSVLLLAL